MSKVVEISFVCLGNICRSPLAQGVFQDLVNREKLNQKILVSSAGTGNWHIGSLPDERMHQTAQSKGIKLTSRAQQFQSEDFNRFNLILAMDHSNLARLTEIAPSNLPPDKLMLFRSFDPESNGDQDVPDPYYGDAKGFDEVYQMVKRTCPKILAYLKSHFLNRR
jgi:protein-tyrosine phosphatase